MRDALWKQIRDGLPGVKYEVQRGIKDCTTKLHQLGKARVTKKEKQAYLNRISGSFSSLIQAAIDGVYMDPFFASYPGQQDAFSRRLRANIQKTLIIYAGKMLLHGHTLKVVEDDSKSTRSSPTEFVMRSDYLELVKKLMVEYRGCELPGAFNPLVVGDLFSRQCKPWERITQSLAEEVHEAAATTFKKMISELRDGNTRYRLIEGLIQPSLHKLRKNPKEKLDDLLEPRLSSHPISNNDYLIHSVQEIQGRRYDRAFDKISLRICGYNSETAPSTKECYLKCLLQNLQDDTWPNFEEYSVSLAANVPAAYYKVALKKFTDDVSVNAVETCLVQRLPGVFSLDVAWDLSDEEVERLGSEDKVTVSDGDELQKMLEVLEKGLKGLDDFTAISGTQA